jgi:hypothetical protein
MIFETEPSSNFYEKTQSNFNFDAHVRLGVSYNFKEAWQSIEALKDVKLENAAKYLAASSVAGYLGAGAANPYVATYGTGIASMLKGDSLDESLAENGDYINDANTINNAGKGGSGIAGLTVELAYFESKSGYKQTDVVSNNISSNSDINLTSANSDLNIHSTNLAALNNINLNARKGDINILADASHSDSFSRSFGLTVSIPLIGKGGAGSINFSKSSSVSNTYINSSLNAGNEFNLNSGGNTNIISSNIIASNINMLIAGDLNLESKQNTSNSKSMSFGIGGGYSTAGGGKSGSGNLSYSTSKAERNWVDNQASIIGTSSVTINVGQNTNLVGSVITNSTNSKTTKDAIDGGNLTLNTNTLTFSNLYDSDEARSFGIGLGGNLRSGGNGSGSISLDYSMHDFKQTTNATIGNGIIKTGTSLNLDSNNNLISVDGGIIYGEEGSKTYAASGLNRNIQISQLETKHLEVKPIHIKETFEFGRNSSSNQKSADSNGSGSGSDSSSSSRPTIWQDITKDRSDQSTAQAAGSMVSDVGSGLLTNLTITLKDLGYQINPLRGFGNIVDGISTDIGNMTTEVTGNQIKGLQVKNQIDIAANDVAAKIWASPNTVLGLAYGGVGYLYGVATGQDVKITLGNNAVQFENMPQSMVDRPFALGNTILYSVYDQPKSTLYSSYTNTYVGVDADGESIYPTVGDHERQHTYQYQKFGPFFIPAYILNGAVNASKVRESLLSFPGHRGNDFEIGADKGAIIDTKQREDIR